MNATVFWDVMPCGVVYNFQCFGRTCCLHFHCRKLGCMGEDRGKWWPWNEQLSVPCPNKLLENQHYGTAFTQDFRHSFRQETRCFQDLAQVEANLPVHVHVHSTSIASLMIQLMYPDLVYRILVIWIRCNASGWVLIYQPEDGGITFLKNSDNNLPDYMASHTRWQ